MNRKDNPQALAAQFSALLREYLSARDLQIVIERNRTLPEHCCASHDFCDANVIMAEAFKMVTGREPQCNSDADAALWSDAWERAKRAEFYLVGSTGRVYP